jgi:hypothetical protein
MRSADTSSQLGLREHDEKQLYTARQNLNDLRNIYAVLFDILNKNIQKVGLLPLHRILALIKLIPCPATCA